MYLPQDDAVWTKLNRTMAEHAIGTLNDHLDSTRGLKAALVSSPHGVRATLARVTGTKPPARTEHPALSVEGVDTRPLPFYGEDWLLYRFACVIEDDPDLAGYERLAHLFAVRAPIDAFEDSAPWTLLDWTSSPLHQLNVQAGLDVSRLDPEHVREYLVFFCSFLGGEEDVDYTFTPFLIPGSSKDFDWESALVPLEERAEMRHLTMFEPVAGVEEADVFDLPPVDARTETKAYVEVRKKRADNRASLDLLPGVIAKLFDEMSGRNPPRPEVPAVAGESGETGDENAVRETPALCFKGVLVWYRNTLFHADFSVNGDGAIQIDEDTPVAGVDTLPLPQLDVKQARPPVPLLCRRKKREEIAAEELLARIRQFLAVSDGPRPPIRLRGLRVSGDVTDKSVFAGTVRLEDIEFTSNVVFDDTVFEGSLELLGCRFLERFSARNATVKGALRLDRSYVHGAIDDASGSSAEKQRRVKPTLDLRGLEAKGGVFADHLTVFGRIRAQWARIGGVMRARGLQVYRRGNDADDERAIDLSHMTVDGPLDLIGNTSLSTFGEAVKARRTFIGGALVMHGLRVRQADLRGVRIYGYLDLESCEISGSVNLGVLDFDDGERGWRARIETDLDLSRSRAGQLELSGCFVGGPLTLVGLRLEDSLFARLHDRFRTRIGAAAVLSGASVRGDIDCAGAEITGLVEFITGYCGRLRLCASPWLAQEKKPMICGTSAGGVLLMDLQVGAGIDLTGLRTVAPGGNSFGRAAYVEGGFVALGTSLGGGLRFWREDAEAHFRSQFAERGLNPNDDAAKEAIEKTIAEIKARVGGKLDLRGIRTAGSINLGCCEIDDSVCLDNARIGGNLRASDGNAIIKCAKDFTADLARIEGDVDLRRLEVRGKLSARDTRVDGNVLLADATDIERQPRHARVEGVIDLAGLHAGASLVISGDNLADNTAQKGKPCIDLSRSRIGQLRVLGFESAGESFQFGHCINLLAIQVGDWRFEDDRQVRALLRKSEPFDAGNYIDVEQRLARIGKKSLANDIYCDMKDRQEKSLAGLKRCWHWCDNVFSGHGTKPLRMAVLLLVSVLPVLYVFSDHRNVEFVLTESQEGGSAGTPVSNGRPYDLALDWGKGKAFGLAASYAIPFYGGARPEVVRARLNGTLCAPYEASPLPGQHDPAPAACKPLPLLGWVSPHGFAMIVSVIQFILWILIAANLPTIIRRRS